MQLTLKYIKRTTELFIELLNSLSIEQINEMPKGFNNNIGWNFGHVVVSTQSLCYQRSGVRPDMVIPFRERFQRGSRPETFINKEEIEALKAQAISSLVDIEKDISNNIFAKIDPYSTATYGFEMCSIEEVLTCVLAHVSLHYGYSLALKKALN